MTQYAQQSQLVATTPGALEAGRWYDVKIALRGHRMDCFLDGSLDRGAAAEQIADNYQRFIKVYDDAESAAKV